MQVYLSIINRDKFRFGSMTKKREEQVKEEKEAQTKRRKRRKGCCEDEMIILRKYIFNLQSEERNRLNG